MWHVRAVSDMHTNEKQKCCSDLRFYNQLKSITVGGSFKFSFC